MFSELASVSDEYHKSLIAECVEELDVNLQYCHYALKRTDGVNVNLEEMLAVAQESSKQEGDIQDKLKVFFFFSVSKGD